MPIDAGSVHSELTLDLSKYDAAMKAAEGQMQAFAQQAVVSSLKMEQSFTGRLEEMGKKMQTMGKSIFTHVTLPLAGIATAAAKVGMDFEAGMSEVQAISGATGAGLEALTEKAKEMGAETKFSATQSAEALKYMAMAGWDTQQMLGGLDGVMMLAAASGEDLGTVSDIVTDALTAFGMQAAQAGEFADLLASAASNANTNVGMMGASFKYVAPLFGALGYSAEDAALAIGLMANAGIKGEQAGTTLRAAITRLQKPAADAATAIAELGLQTTDANGNMLPFIDLMNQMRDRFGGLTEAQQAQYAATIFGQEAMSGMLAIVNASPADYEKLTNATRNYSGAATEMAEIMQDNVKGSLTMLKSQLEAAGIEIFEVLEPHLQELISTIRSGVEWFNNLSPAAQGAIVNFALLAAAVAPVVIMGGKLATGISSISKLLGTLRKGMAATTAATAASTTATTANTAATAAMSGGMTAAIGPAALFQTAIKGVSSSLAWLAANPIVAVIGALALLGAAFVSARNKAKQAMEDMTNAELGKIQEGYEREKQLAFGAVDSKIEAANTAFEKRKALLDKEYQAAKETIQKETEAQKQGSQDRLDLLKSEHDAVIQQLRDEYGVYKEASNSKMDLAREEAKNAIDLLEEQADKARELHKERIKQLEDEALAALDAETQAQIKALQDQIDGIDELTEAEDKAERERSDREKVALLKSQIAHEEDAERKAELQQDLQELLSEIERRALLERREAQKEDLREQIERVKTAAEEQKRLIKENLNAELEEKKRVEIAKLDEALASIDAQKVAIQDALTEKLIKLEEERAEKERIENAKYELAKAGLDKELASLEETIALKQEKLAGEYAAKVEHEERMYKALTNRLADEKTAVNEHYEELKKSAEAYERAAKRAAEAAEHARASQKAEADYWYQQGTLPGDIAGNALGTNYWRGGLTWVGEQGPELIELPRGSKVHTNQESERMASGSGGITQHITINSPSPLTPSEVARKTKQASQQLAMQWGV